MGGMTMGPMAYGGPMGGFGPPPAFPENLPAEEMVLSVVGERIFSRVDVATLMSMCPDVNKITDTVMEALRGFDYGSACSSLKERAAQCSQAKTFCEKGPEAMGGSGMTGVPSMMGGPGMMGGPPSMGGAGMMGGPGGGMMGGPGMMGGAFSFSCPPDEAAMAVQCKEQAAKQFESQKKEREEEVSLSCELGWERASAMGMPWCEGGRGGASGGTTGPASPTYPTTVPAAAGGYPGSQCRDVSSEYDACLKSGGDPLTYPDERGCKALRCNRGGPPYSPVPVPGQSPYPTPSAPPCRDVTPDYNACIQRSGIPEIVPDAAGCKQISCKAGGASAPPAPTSPAPAPVSPAPVPSPAPSPPPSPAATPVATPVATPATAAGERVLKLQGPPGGYSGGGFPGGYGGGPPGGFAGGGPPGDYGRGGPPSGYGQGGPGGPPGGYGQGGPGGGFGGPPAGGQPGQDPFAGGSLPPCEKEAFLKDCRDRASKMMFGSSTGSANYGRICELEAKLAKRRMEKVCTERERGTEQCVQQATRGCSVLNQSVEKCSVYASETGIRELVRKKAEKECKFAAYRSGPAAGADPLAGALAALRENQQNVGESVKPWLQAEEGRVLDTAEGLKRAKEQEKGKDAFYGVGKFFGFQAGREKEDAAKARALAKNLSQTVKSLETLLADLEEGAVRTALQAQVKTLKSQVEELDGDAEEKEEGAEGFIGAIKGLFGFKPSRTEYPNPDGNYPNPDSNKPADLRNYPNPEGNKGTPAPAYPNPGGFKGTPGPGDLERAKPK